MAASAIPSSFETAGSTPLPVESDINENFSPSIPWVLDRPYARAVTLVFDQGEVVVIVDIHYISDDQNLAAIVDNLIQLGLIQKARLEVQGYR